MAQPNKTTYQVVSMLAGEQKITLFSSAGEVVDIPHNGDYDTGSIMAYLKDKITGMNAVALDLMGYLSKKATEINQVLADGGIEITQVINGETVQGIFYPKKMETTVKIKDEQVSVPGIDNLLRHAKRANQFNPQSVTNFLERMIPILNTRAHSAEDLMNFIGQSEMPLTNDGRIICYKRVSKSQEAGIYLDAASKTIKQRVGSRVFMDVEKVDPNRYNSCSNGLHVANQIYMSQFNGDITMLVLVSPEEFIAVPKGENGKARVCAYDVIGIMDEKAHVELSQGYVKDNDGLKMLIAQAIEGTHVQPFEMVHAGQKTLIKITPIEGRREVTESKAPVSAKTLKNTRSLDADVPTTTFVDQKIDARSVINTMAKEAVKLPDEVIIAFKALAAGQSKSAAGRAAGMSDRTVGRWMEKYSYDTWLKASLVPPVDTILTNVIEPVVEVKPGTFDMFVDFPRDKLITMINIVRKVFSIDLKEAKHIVEGPQPMFTDSTANAIALMSKTLMVHGIEFEVVEHGEARKPVDKPVPKAKSKFFTSTPTAVLSKAQQARIMYDAWIKDPHMQNLHKLLDFKKAAKKGWDSFGFTDNEILHIKRSAE